MNNDMTKAPSTGLSKVDPTQVPTSWPVVFSPRSDIRTSVSMAVAITALIVLQLATPAAIFWSGATLCLLAAMATALFVQHRSHTRR